MPWWPFRRRTNANPAAAATRSVRGRRFAAGVPYVLPKDMQEVSRLDFQHYMLRQVRRGNHEAPVSMPRDVLDVGTGTGRWALEASIEWPSAHIIGLDIVPPPIDEGAASQDIRPPNYAFVAGNVLEGLPFPDASFDYVHQRMLVGALPRDRWPMVVQELVRVTRPRGWIELVEAGESVGGGPALEQLNRWGLEVMARRGIDVSMSNKIGILLAQAGLQGVQAHPVNIPLGKRGGRVGLMMESNYFSALGAIRPLLVSQGLTDEETHARMLALAREEVARNRCAVAYYVAYGQRPAV